MQNIEFAYGLAILSMSLYQNSMQMLRIAATSLVSGAQTILFSRIQMQCLLVWVAKSTGKCAELLTNKVDRTIIKKDIKGKHHFKKFNQSLQTLFYNIQCLWNSYVVIIICQNIINTRDNGVSSDIMVTNIISSIYYKSILKFKNHYSLPEPMFFSVPSPSFIFSCNNRTFQHEFQPYLKVVNQQNMLPWRYILIIK